MQVTIVQPNPDFPFVWVQIPVSNEARMTESRAMDIDIALRNRRISILGKWEAYTVHISRAPGLLEDEHVKPPKRKKK